MNEEYKIDFERFFDYINKLSQKEKKNVTTVTEIWQPDGDNELKLINKEVIETRNVTNDESYGIKYDFMNNILNYIIAPGLTPEGKNFMSVTQMTFGQKIIFNSLLEAGIINEIKK